MDSTELHYLTFSPDDIWTEMQVAYVQAGGDVLYPGDEKEMLLRAVQAIIIQSFAGVDNALRMQTLRYAVGDYLDAYGEMRNCARIQAVAAAATVTITTNTTGRSGVIPAGTAMTADGEKYYLLTEDVTLTGNTTSVTADITAAEAGAAGNGLTEGTAMYLSAGNPGVNSIIVTTAASGGVDVEDDETYRERIRTYGLTSVTTGPAQQYESVAKATSASIVDAKALNGGAGNVNVYLLFTDTISTETKQASIAAVLAALSADDVRPLTDHVSVAEAGEISYTLNVGYTLGNNATLSAMQQAVDTYTAWQDQVIGQPFNPDRLMALMYQAGAARVTWQSGSSIDGSSAIEYTEIDADKRLRGVITLNPIT